MHHKSLHICFTLISDDEVFQVITFQGEYFNLMQLINDKIYIEDFGACTGMGRCGTCLVAFNEENVISKSDRNEINTLKSMCITNSLLRLSCQIEINKQLNNAIIKIINQ